MANPIMPGAPGGGSSHQRFDRNDAGEAITNEPSEHDIPDQWCLGSLEAAIKSPKPEPRTRISSTGFNSILRQNRDAAKSPSEFERALPNVHRSAIKHESIQLILTRCILRVNAAK